MSSVFFYGSLMSPVVLIRVLLGSGASEQAKLEKFKSIRLIPASLKGYIRSSLKGEDYPAIVHTGKEQDKVTGILCEGLSEQDVKALDIFEGEVNIHEYIPIMTLLSLLGLFTFTCECDSR
ncbi:unnamed protein product [Rhizopus microsporus]